MPESETSLKIVLAGKEYPVTPLVGRQLKFVMPALMRWRKVATDITQMQPENYDDLYTIIYHGAVRLADKNLTPEKLLDIPGIGFNELMAAVAVITQATGLFLPLKEGDKPSGEENPTGTNGTGT